MHLALFVITKLRRIQPSLSITDDEVFCVSAAGLLHDLGHGPFSHVFDHEFIPSVEHRHFRHEDMSVALIADLFRSNDIEIEEEHLLLIQSLVSPSTHQSVYDQYRARSRGFLFEIVANEINGVDVDKMDYLLRDSRCIGKPLSFDYQRLLKHARVVEDHICFAEKTSYQLFNLFEARYKMFKIVYSHKAGKAIELMICDVLKAANEYFQITAKTDSVEAYLGLTDHIMTEIENTTIDRKRKGWEGLVEAQALIKRMNRRDLYKCCGYILLSAKDIAPFNPKPEPPERDDVDGEKETVGDRPSEEKR